MVLSTSPEIVELHGTVKLTYEEFQNIPYDGLGHHLLHGVHIVTPAPSIKHQMISAKIFTELNNFIQKKNAGVVLSAPVDVRFSVSDGYQPDIIFIDTSRLLILAENYIEGPPTVIIEITSKESATADYGWKKDLAEKYKVQEYWVIDTTYKLVEIFTFVPGTKATYVTGDKAKSSLPILEGFTLTTDELFKD